MRTNAQHARMFAMPAIIAQDEFEFQGYNPVVDLVSTLRGAGYGSLLNRAKVEDEENIEVRA